VEEARRKKAILRHLVRDEVLKVTHVAKGKAMRAMQIPDFQFGF